VFRCCGKLVCKRHSIYWPCSSKHISSKKEHASVPSCDC
jgi:hypothetical protein